MWWLAATTPGRIPSVRHAWMTKWPMRVVIRTSPFSSMPSCSASVGCSQSGWRWLISFSHLLLADRVWMSVGMRNVGTRMRSPADMSRSSQWTWLLMKVGMAYSGQPQSRMVAEKNSSFLDGVGNPSLASPSMSMAGEPSPMNGMWPSMSSNALWEPAVPGRRQTPASSRNAPSRSAAGTWRS